VVNQVSNTVTHVVTDAVNTEARALNTSVNLASIGAQQVVKAATTPIIDVPFLGKVSPADIGITALSIFPPTAPLGIGLGLAKGGYDLYNQLSAPPAGVA